jgi:mono/diheme cytochrome c family protein
MTRKAIAGFILTMTTGVAALLIAPAAARSQEAADTTTSPCHGIDASRIGGVLRGVPRYGSTYVLVIPERLAATIPDAKAPGVKDLRAAVQGGSAAADAARAAGIVNMTESPFDASAPYKLVQGVANGSLDAAVMWAPLAGMSILELGLDGAVSTLSIDRPGSAPDDFDVAATAEPCSSAIADELDVSGALPAELLMPVEIRPMLGMHAPKFDVAEAQQGGEAFNTVCARCHGADAVADPHGLAPVDLRLSIRRFSYPGFRYIVMNGRPARSMPPLRGTVTDDQIRTIYQYLKARSNRVLTSANDNAPVQTNSSEKGTNE